MDYDHFFNFKYRIIRLSGKSVLFHGEMQNFSMANFEAISSFEKTALLLETRFEDRHPEFQLFFVNPLTSRIYCSNKLKLQGEKKNKLENQTMRREVKLKLKIFDLEKSGMRPLFSNKQVFALDASNIFYFEISKERFRGTAIFVDNSDKAREFPVISENTSVDLPLARLVSEGPANHNQLVDSWFFAKKQILIVLFRNTVTREFLVLVYALRFRSFKMLRIRGTIRDEPVRLTRLPLPGSSG